MKEANGILIADVTLALKLITALYKQGSLNRETYENILKKYAAIES